MRNILPAVAAALIVTTAAANAATINGSYSVTSNNGATITNLLADPFSLNLLLNVSQTFDLVNVFENSTGTSTVTATFNFTSPSILADSGTGTDVFSITGSAKHDSLTWSGGGILTENFSDGSVVSIDLADASANGSSYSGLKVPVTFTLTKAGTTNSGPTPVPEPLTLGIFGIGVAGMAVYRRRKSAKA